MVRVIDSADHDWWWGECNNREGWFSTAFVRVVEESSHPLDLYKAVKTQSAQTANPYDSRFQPKICEDDSTKATVANLAARFKGLLDEINEEKKSNEVFLEIDTWQNKVHQWTGPSLKHTSSELVFYSEGILYQSAVRESVMLYLFDNQLVFCARTGDGGLKLKNRFDLARTTFSCENGLFRIYEKQDGLKSCALMQVYIKNKKDREKWQYLLKLEIGFAKIKEWF
ncbi:Oidioi.mRNA.OKI2018_I69.PAR.g11527.t1.cds [Oikopleura dioica]|uniref:Oidioi.mRNA.OKI2018_I69.PAR.g11527.t1.cds n=1 Tax=Oikopleura dioica TaxID=34765 RepID=A0ABN7S0U2_OIKDI|nr:Oidioi.mRNA.OKI2018_I69.PAR.g11527.t1.cds [Oikopleura dioica]